MPDYIDSARPHDGIQPDDTPSGDAPSQVVREIVPEITADHVNAYLAVRRLYSRGLLWPRRAKSSHEHDEEQQEKFLRDLNDRCTRLCECLSTLVPAGPRFTTPTRENKDYEDLLKGPEHSSKSQYGAAKVQLGAPTTFGRDSWKTRIRFSPDIPGYTHSGSIQIQFTATLTHQIPGAPTPHVEMGDFLKTDRNHARRALLNANVALARLSPLLGIDLATSSSSDNLAPWATWLLLPDGVAHAKRHWERWCSAAQRDPGKPRPRACLQLTLWWRRRHLWVDESQPDGTTQQVATFPWSLVARKAQGIPLEQGLSEEAAREIESLRNHSLAQLAGRVLGGQFGASLYTESAWKDASYLDIHSAWLEKWDAWAGPSPDDDRVIAERELAALVCTARAFEEAFGKIRERRERSLKRREHNAAGPAVWAPPRLPDPDFSRPKSDLCSEVAELIRKLALDRRGLSLSRGGATLQLPSGDASLTVSTGDDSPDQCLTLCLREFQSSRHPSNCAEHVLSALKGVFRGIALDLLERFQLGTSGRGSCSYAVHRFDVSERQNCEWLWPAVPVFVEMLAYDGDVEGWEEESLAAIDPESFTGDASYDFFLSCRPDDDALARRISDMLKGRGRSVYSYHYVTNVGGSDFWWESLAAIRRSKVFVPIVSRWYWEGPWAVMELWYASNAKKQFFPLFVSDWANGREGQALIGATRADATRAICELQDATYLDPPLKAADPEDRVREVDEQLKAPDGGLGTRMATDPVSVTEAGSTEAWVAEAVTAFGRLS